MKYVFYAAKGSGSVACEALLVLGGMDYERIDIDLSAEPRDPRLLAANPMGQVPVLQLPDGTIMTESAAIVVYLADLMPGKQLAPALDASARASYLRWMVFLSAAVYQTVLRKFYPDKYVADASLAPSVCAAAEARLRQEFRVMESCLGDTPFILGARMSALDIYAAMLVSWETDPEGLARECPRLVRMCRATVAQPVIREIWERNELG